MSSVDANPSRPPRPTQRPGMLKSQSAKDAKLPGYSLDLESVNFGELESGFGIGMGTKEWVVWELEMQF